MQASVYNKAAGTEDHGVEVTKPAFKSALIELVLQVFKVKFSNRWPNHVESMAKYY